MTSVMYDEMTGLPTSDLLLDRLTMALHGAERTGDAIAVMKLELGPVDGPNGPVDLTVPAHAELAAIVLREVGRRLTTTVRAFDSVGRIGEQRFGIVFQGRLDLELLHSIARRILFELSPPVEVGRDHYFITARIGGTTAEPRIDGPEAILARATEALDDARVSVTEIVVLREP